MFKIVKERKLNENEESLIKVLKILFDNSTLSNVKKVAQAKKLASALGIDDKKLVNECLKKNLTESMENYPEAKNYIYNAMKDFCLAGGPGFIEGDEDVIFEDLDEEGIKYDKEEALKYIYELANYGPYDWEEEEEEDY